jgi:hypothetical protein
VISFDNWQKVPLMRGPQAERNPLRITEGFKHANRNAAPSQKLFCVQDMNMARRPEGLRIRLQRSHCAPARKNS